MATNFPTGFDTDGDLPAKSLGNVIPSGDWNRITDAIQALQAKVGVDASAVAGSVDNLVKKPFLTGWKRYFCDPNGSDAYDGLSQRFPKATIPAVMTLASTQGDVYLGPASFPVSDTIIVPQSVRLHGTSWHTAASLGTELTLSSFPDDGRAVILTAANASADATKGLLENFCITGPGSMTGGGAGLGLRNAQNGFVARNIQVRNMALGVHLHTTTQNTNFPAYCFLENVWAATCLRGWEIEMGTCVTTLLNCAGDFATGSGFLGPMLVTNSAVQGVSAVAITAATSSGYTATITATAHGLSAGHLTEVSGVTPAGYNMLARVMTVADANTFTYVTSAPNLGAGSAFGVSQRKNGGERGELILIGFKAEHNGTGVIGVEHRSNGRLVAIGTSVRLSSAGSQPAFSYTGPRYSDALQGTLFTEPPVTLIECQSTQHPSAFTAPQFGIVEPAVITAGQTQNINWPKKSRIEPAHVARPAGAVRETFPRFGTAMTAQAMLLSGRLNYVAMPLRAGDIISSFTFCSQTTAAVTPTNQWAVLMNPSRLVVAKSADKTTEAWAAPAMKTFTVTTDKDDNPIAFYRVPADGLYFVGICVVAATVPSLAGVSGGSTTIADVDPNMSANSDTGLTDPVSCPDTPSAGTAAAAHFYCYVS